MVSDLNLQLCHLGCPWTCTRWLGSSEPYRHMMGRGLIGIPTPGIKTAGAGREQCRCSSRGLSSGVICAKALG